MSDRTLILGTLRTAPGVLLIEPGPHLVMQDEVHTLAKEERERRGLPPSHPYVGWHTQANGFGRGGTLVRPQRVFFGGDRAVVARALSLLEPHGFAVLGGRSDTESFVLHRDASPERVDHTLADAWRTRLAVLGDDRSGPAPLRDGEEALLHALVAHPGMRELLAPAVRALRIRSALTPADLDTTLSPDGVDALGAEASPVVAHALAADHPGARRAAAALAGQGRADSRVLTAWDDTAEAVRAARASALAGREATTYLDLVEADGGDPVAAAVALAEDIRTHGGEDSGARVAEVALRLVGRYGASGRDNALRALRDERVPSWLRVVIADRWTRSPVTVDGLRADHSHPLRPGLATAPGAVATAAAWPDAVDEVRASAGLPPSPGFDLAHGPDRNAAIELRETVVARHLDGLRAALAREDLDEPALAVLLELLSGANALRPQDLAPFARTWRKRLFVKPTPYTDAPPALVVYTAALAGVDAPAAGKVVDAVLRDKRQWSLPVRLMVHGAVGRGREEDLATEAELVAPAHGGGKGSGAARHALCLVRARLRGITVVEAACASLLEAPEQPPYVRRGFATVAVSLAEGGTGLWEHRFRERSGRALEAALRVAGDATLPEEARRRVLRLADETTVLDRPEHTRPVRVHADEVERLRAAREEVRARLVT
ncbi:hypothetical protein [Nocardiopsis ansamitocini]|uniref:Uncharacterized protein n=1 Tax=Nocardiopsis ansamitocini TaxID=1670832 RepID=A0A9W6PAC5_9ACTN|nr:hypothetical protein [Nocardiopsis ansamitocini]GLU49918.1 hypothetical protein Nans01_42690 [Nocardiopsis ansamitocini]